MKKLTALALAVLILLLTLAGCGASAGKAERNSDRPAATPAAAAPAPAAEKDGYESYKDADLAANEPQTVQAIQSDKIIYTATIRMETLKFDDTLGAIDEMIKSFSAFIENSYVTGVNYGSRQGLRSAQYVIRVPSTGFEGMKSYLDGLGNVTYSGTNADNITTRFRDTESRKAVYEIEESRLLEMLKKTDSVSEMLEIESRLSEVRYNIESLQSQLLNWQSRVDYSTVTLSVDEVRALTDEPVVTLSYWERLAESVKDSFRDVWRFIENAFIFLLSAIPVLLIPAAIVVVVLLLTKKRRAARRAAKQARLTEPQDKE